MKNQNKTQDIKNLDKLNSILSTFDRTTEPGLMDRADAVCIIESDVIFENSGWCTPEAWDNDPAIALYRQMVDIMENIPLVIYKNGVYEFEG